MSTLDVVRQQPDHLQVTALAAGRNWKRLAEQVRQFKPRLAVISEPAFLDKLREAVRDLDVEVACGMEGLRKAATCEAADTLVSALVGSIGLEPVLAGIHAKKTICLANKETLVVAGRLVMQEARRAGVPIIPIDSEHSAIFQCLADRDKKHVQRLILTASGGPFRQWSADQMSRATPQDALKHPNWDMGGKITIDSATLMNKGLEVIEARWLFDIEFDRIEVLVHPQSVIHSMVEFVDGSVLGQMGAPDMRGPIQYALSFPNRWQAACHKLDLLKVGALTFESPRRGDFPCLDFAFEAGRRGGTLPCVMNAANEVAVDAFLKGRLTFSGIAKLIRRIMDIMPFQSEPNLDDLLAADREARIKAQELLPSVNA
ncbi:MAG TPA: 1-deoxy-D-xylulose-5-phosphate reductoisomerase [Candidatus Ozemobacteraceae bacterium]|nr:1-deoxy-D-xylulose-5-phosphate reductoisomerase [Candidatus Ozemobacteraceae bacterium]